MPVEPRSEFKSYIPPDQNLRELTPRALVLGALLGVIFGAISSPGAHIKELAMEFYDEALYRSRKPAALFLLGFLSVLFFCSGILLTILEMTAQYDHTGEIQATATLWSGGGLALVFLGV